MQALGAFVHGDTFSILFLYAESTLEKLLMEDFAGFPSESIWKQILGITEALECLHNDDPVTIHSDIKPQNIFLHDKTLKLADFGSSRLINGIKSTENQDFWAGRAYSPPELDIRFPAYDIWSLGSVMSEVATSDAQKRNALIEYRSERTQEDEDIVNLPCFHKNKMMKAAVRERHKILLNLVQQNKGGDGEELSSWQMRFYTRDFFGLIEQMLGPEGQRPSASEVVKQLRHFINQASEYDQESTGQPDVWQRSWAGTIPMSHLSHYRRL
jgi:serine/threonine protein kinase